VVDEELLVLVEVEVDVLLELLLLELLVVVVELLVVELAVTPP
jgi:hypothetical protein